jgi:serine/threonine-protein kinase RsbW
LNNHLNITLESRLAEIPATLSAVDAFLEHHGASGDVVFDIRIALEELLTNIVSYGYDDDGLHRISLALVVESGRASCTLTDDGIPFDPLGVPPPDLDAGIDERAIGGLGIHFVRQTMQSVAYERIGGSNVLRMSRSLTERE